MKFTTPFKNCTISFSNLGGIFDSEELQRELEVLERQSIQPDFWAKKDTAESVMSKIRIIHRKLQPWQELCSQVDELRDLLNLALSENDESLSSDLEATYKNIRKKYDDQRLIDLFYDEQDPAHSYLSIHSGAGGTESCDWVSMLLRMYTRWIDRKGFKAQTLDIQDAEGGIKSVTLQVQGMYAYGYLKGETGIHRLVRISPFDSSARRHTTFASVYSSPVIDNDIDVNIKPEDIRIDTYRSGGAGGQHLNTTDSAVRITHLETGIVVQCQNERSQHKNKDMAMKILRSRLFDYYKKIQEEETNTLSEKKMDIAWGSQIRSYIFQPYTMVKDIRTKVESGNIQAVMDGNIDMFIDAYLQKQWQERSYVHS